jgi:hypothetical protein
MTIKLHFEGVDALRDGFGEGVHVDQFGFQSASLC